MLKGVSKETKVGSLAAVAITVLILGYNYMVGKDNPLSTSREFYVMYDSTQGLADNTALFLNGFRVGQLRKLTMDVEARKVVAKLEVYNDIVIPSDSRVKIESSLLGGTALKLIIGRSSKAAEDGDTLRPDYTHDVISMINEKITPIASGADTMLRNINALLSRKSLTTSLDQLPSVLASLNNTITEISATLNGVRPGLASTMDNVGRFSGNLAEYNKSISASLGSFQRISAQLDSVQLVKLTTSLQHTIAGLQSVTDNLQGGKGTLGKLAQDDKLYNNLVLTTNSLQCLMNDLNKYPEKYLPLPWGKKQRKKAKAESAKNQCFTDSAR